MFIDKEESLSLEKCKLQKASLIKAREDYIKSQKDTMLHYLDSSQAELLFNSNDEFDSIKEETKRLIKCIEEKEIPESISTTFLESLYGKTIFREYYKIEVGFNVVTKEFAKSLYDIILKDKKCLEIMSGTGALAKALQDCGANIIATDDYSGIDFYPLTNNFWTSVEKIDCMDAIRKYGKDIDYMLVSWLPLSKPINLLAIQLLHKINPDCMIIIIGEEGLSMSATSSEEFYNNIDILAYFENSYDEDISERTRMMISMRKYISPQVSNVTLNYKTWGVTHDRVYIARYKNNKTNNEGDNKK